MLNLRAIGLDLTSTARIRQAAIERFPIDRATAIEEGTMSDPGFLAAAFDTAPPIMHYLGWSLTQGTPAAAHLFDEMVEESVRLLGMAAKEGMIRPTDHLRERSAVLLTMQLGALVLHEHLARTIGQDVFQTEGLLTLSQMSMEIFSGLFRDATATDTAAALEKAAEGMRKEADHG